MSDDQIVEQGQEVVQEAEAAPAEVTPSLMLVLGEATVPALVLHKFDAAYPDGYFIQAQVPASEAKIRQSGREIRFENVVVKGGNRAQRRAGGKTEARQLVQWDEDEFFLAKCEAQITKFRLLGKDAKTGQQTEVVFNPTGNDDVYRRWLHPKNKNFRELLEQYLDWVAGRDDGEFDEQFEILGNA
jgi:hypothetical protein